MSADFDRHTKSIGDVAEVAAQRAAALGEAFGKQTASLSGAATRAEAAASAVREVLQRETKSLDQALTESSKRIDGINDRMHERIRLLNVAAEAAGNKVAQAGEMFRREVVSLAMESTKTLDSFAEMGKTLQNQGQSLASHGEGVRATVNDLAADLAKLEATLQRQGGGIGDTAHAVLGRIESVNAAARHPHPPSHRCRRRRHGAQRLSRGDPARSGRFHAARHRDIDRQGAGVGRLAAAADPDPDRQHRFGRQPHRRDRRDVLAAEGHDGRWLARCAQRAEGSVRRHRQGVAATVDRLRRHRPAHDRSRRRFRRPRAADQSGGRDGSQSDRRSRFRPGAAHREVGHPAARYLARRRDGHRPHARTGGRAADGVKGGDRAGRAYPRRPNSKPAATVSCAPAARSSASSTPPRST